MKRSNNKLRFLYFLMLTVTLAVIVNVFLVTILKVHIRSNTSLNDYVQSVSNVEERIFASRGNIYDKEGSIVAQDVKTYDIICYLDEERSVSYISPMITETVKATIKGTEQRLSRLIFKVAVELGKLAHITAAVNGVDEEDIRELHTMCINEVRKINGIINSEDAAAYQQS